MTRRGTGARLRLDLSALSFGVGNDSPIHASLDLSLSVTVVQLLSDALIDFNEFHKFLVQNLLLLFKLNDLRIKLLQTVFQVIVVLQNGHFIFLLDCQLHLSYR